MKLLTNPIFLRMAAVFFTAVFAFVVALLVMRRLRKGLIDEDFSLDTPRESDNLPLHTYTLDGEIYAQPCAEMLMTEQQAELILDQGLMPLVPIRGTDIVRLIRFQSISEPLSRLAGPWN